MPSKEAIDGVAIAQILICEAVYLYKHGWCLAVLSRVYRDCVPARQGWKIDKQKTLAIAVGTMRMMVEIIKSIFSNQGTKDEH
jgi:hypothetical protein